MGGKDKGDSVAGYQWEAGEGGGERGVQREDSSETTILLGWYKVPCLICIIY